MDTIPQDIPQKQCTKCKQFFPASVEFFHKHSRLGLQPRCKKCRAEDNLKYNTAHREQNRKRSRAYHANNSEKENAKSKEYRQANRDLLNARRRDNYSVEQEKRLASSRQSYQKRKERVKKRHHEYYVANRHAFRVRDANRRAIELGALGKHTPQQIKDQYQRQKGKCYYCQQKVKWGEHHVDHTYPLSRVAGTDIPANDISYLVIACRTCNLEKGDKFPWEWPKGGRLL